MWILNLGKWVAVLLGAFEMPECHLLTFFPSWDFQFMELYRLVEEQEKVSVWKYNTFFKINWFSLDAGGGGGSSLEKHTEPLLSQTLSNSSSLFCLRVVCRVWTLWNFEAARLPPLFFPAQPDVKLSSSANRAVVRDKRGRGGWGTWHERKHLKDHLP